MRVSEEKLEEKIGLLPDVVTKFTVISSRH